MYSIYLIDKNKRIYSLVTTEDKNIAIQAYKDKITRQELYGRKLIAIIKKNETIKDIHRFDVNISQCIIEEKFQVIYLKFKL